MRCVLCGCQASRDPSPPRPPHHPRSRPLRSTPPGSRSQSRIVATMASSLTSPAHPATPDPRSQSSSEMRNSCQHRTYGESPRRSSRPRDGADQSPQSAFPRTGGVRPLSVMIRMACRRDRQRWRPCHPDGMDSRRPFSSKTPLLESKARARSIRTIVPMCWRRSQLILKSVRGMSDRRAGWR